MKLDIGSSGRTAKSSPPNALRYLLAIFEAEMVEEILSNQFNLSSSVL
jgi:hypothetical protein